MLICFTKAILTTGCLVSGSNSVELASVKRKRVQIKIEYLNLKTLKIHLNRQIRKSCMRAVTFPAEYITSKFTHCQLHAQTNTCKTGLISNVTTGLQRLPHILSLALNWMFTILNIISYLKMAFSVSSPS